MTTGCDFRAEQSSVAEGNKEQSVRNRGAVTSVQSVTSVHSYRFEMGSNHTSFGDARLSAAIIVNCSWGHGLSKGVPSGEKWECTAFCIVGDSYSNVYQVLIARCETPTRLIDD